DDALTRQVAAIYMDKLSPAVLPTALPHEQDFILTKGIIKSINYYSQAEPERVATIKQELDNYGLQLKRLNLPDPVLGKNKNEVLLQSITGLVYLLVGLPVYVFGLLHNYLPYIIPSKIARAVTKEEEWHAPIMLTTGIFTFPIFYGLEIWLAHGWL